jgi:hypothetical protein
VENFSGLGKIVRGELEETRYFMPLSKDFGRISIDEFLFINTGCDSAGKLLNAPGRLLRENLAAEASHQSQVTQK